MDHRLMTLREVADYLGVPVAPCMDGDTDPPRVRWRLCSLDSNRVAGLRLVIVGGFGLRRWDTVEGAAKA